MIVQNASNPSNTSIAKIVVWSSNINAIIVVPNQFEAFLNHFSRHQQPSRNNYPHPNQHQTPQRRDNYEPRRPSYSPSTPSSSSSHSFQEPAAPSGAVSQAPPAATTQHSHHFQNQHPQSPFFHRGGGNRGRYIPRGASAKGGEHQQPLHRSHEQLPSPSGPQIEKGQESRPNGNGRGGSGRGRGRGGGRGRVRGQ
jgi:hypothetical protein